MCKNVFLCCWCRYSLTLVVSFNFELLLFASFLPVPLKFPLNGVLAWIRVLLQLLTCYDCDLIAMY